jgi:hypothetical protein
MKGLILEERLQSFVILTKDGQFLEVDKRRSTKTDSGEVVVRSGLRTYYKKIAAVAALFILIFFGATWYTPYGYMTLDVNPSIELSYNRYDRVLKINGLNQEGEEIVSQLPSNNRLSTMNTLGILLKVIKDNRYLEAHENILIVDFNGHNELKERLNRLKSEVNLLDYPSDFTLIIGNHNEYKNIKNREYSPGKYLFIEKIMKRNQNIGTSVLEEKGVDELLDILEDNKGEEDMGSDIKIIRKENRENEGSNNENLESPTNQEKLQKQEGKNEDGDTSNINGFQNHKNGSKQK